MAAAPEPGTVEQELAAMRKICGALDQLDDPSRRRVMRYLVDRYPDANLDGPVLEGHIAGVRYADSTDIPR
jgi:hypothetical protein